MGGSEIEALRRNRKAIYTRISKGHWEEQWGRGRRSARVRFCFVL